ncbi:MAG: PH domain-containing protein, partial [Chloroflexota bacterium]|nr:PH domain-containing protein [Chloroflexota bacterium]
MQNNPTPQSPFRSRPLFSQRRAAALGARPVPAEVARQSALYSHLIHDLHQGELVLGLRRRHPLMLVRPLLVPLLLLLAWCAGLLMVAPFITGLSSADPLLGSSGAPSWLPPLLWVLYIGFALFFVLWTLHGLLDWKDNWVALTTRRLILMDKRFLLREARREVPLQKVQNAVAEYTHPMSMALDFGDLTVDTAGVGTLQFKGMPQPRTMREAIFAQQKAISAAQPPPEDRRKEVIRNLLGAAPSPGAHASAGGPVSSSSPPVPPSGYGALASIFPFAPQRQGSQVTWHKHWFLLVRTLTWP